MNENVFFLNIVFLNILFSGLVMVQKASL